MRRKYAKTISRGLWRLAGLSLAIGLLFFKAASASPPEADSATRPTRGQDRGAGVKAPGKGKGKPKKVQWDKSKAEADPDNAE